MQENHLFEYAVIRIVPQVEREEFLNTGVILYCAGKKFLNAIITLDTNRIQGFCPKLDIAELGEYTNAFIAICQGGNQVGAIGKLILPERFRWLTARRSTVLQTSMVHPGFCADPDKILHRLFSELVSCENYAVSKK